MITSSYRVYRLFLFVFLLSACSLHNHPGTEVLFHEKYRPQIHFSPQQNRMDTPTGLVYVDGEYHLFYRYNPIGTNRPPSCWGHAVSTDLLHWKELSVALSPDSLGSIASGSVVTDMKNTSGFGTMDNPPLVALFTYHNHEIENTGGMEVQSQGLAYSLDKGHTWTKYSGNPVIPNPGIRNFQDPKVCWHELEEQWVMVLAIEGRIRIYTSPDLKEWSYISDFGRDSDGGENVWERPDLFELQVWNENYYETKWILTVNIGFGFTNDWVTGYFVGNFDGKTFSSPQTQPLRIDYGKDYYGGVTFNNLPDRRIIIGWMNNWDYADAVPTSPWRGSLAIPREVRLKKMPGYYLLVSQPVKEVETLFSEQTIIHDIDLVQNIHSTGIEDITSQVLFPLLPSEINIRFKTDNQMQAGFAEKFGIILQNETGESVLIGYDTYHQQFFIDRSHSTQKEFSENFASVHTFWYNIDNSGMVDMRILFDHTSSELFAMGGKVAMSDTFYPSSDFNKIALFAENGKVQVNSISITQLKSIWK